MVNFSDFKDDPKTLIGKPVYIDSGSIGRINKVNAASFTTEGSKSLYNLRDGQLRGTGKWHFVWAKLITEEEVIQISERWKSLREIREMSAAVTARLQAKDLSHEQMCKIIEIIKT